jgi:NitT/TauT family transport system substrate-binding protein
MMGKPMSPSATRRQVLAAAAAGAGLALAGCGRSASSGSSATDDVRIGYFPNLTHAPALVADARGLFARHLGGLGGPVRTSAFSAGPEVLQALFSNSLDVGFLGPSPTITAYTQSRGSAIKVVAGAAAGGASLVVRSGIDGPAGLRGTRIASPQLGNTQDVALRYWLHGQGLRADIDGGGDLSVVPQKNAAALQSFTLGHLDGAWVPEPYATQFVEKGAHVLVDERTLWPHGRFVTTNVVVRGRFLAERPDAVRAFLDAHLDALQLLHQDPSAARTAVAAQITKVTEQKVRAGTLEAAWGRLAFTADPLAATLRASADHAAAVGLLDALPEDGFAGLWDLTPLNAALTARGLPEVSTS